jgi:hypothetical protein
VPPILPGLFEPGVCLVRPEAIWGVEFRTIAKRWFREEAAVAFGLDLQGSDSASKSYYCGFR